MGILFISITVGIILAAFLLIIYLRKNKTTNKPGGPGSQGVVEEIPGKDKGIYD